MTIIRSIILIFFLFKLLKSPTTERNYKEQIDCLAKNIFYEAGSESIFGKIAVAYVTHNRTKTKKFPENYCDVVFQKNQFSWTNDLIYQTKNQTSDLDWRWKESLYVAENFLLYKDRTDGSTFYHEKSRIPKKWTRLKIKRTKQIGNHIFYKLKE